jgi:hypothetical protein
MLHIELHIDYYHHMKAKKDSYQQKTFSGHITEITEILYANPH